MPHVRIEIEEVAGGLAPRAAWHATVAVGGRCTPLSAPDFAAMIAAIETTYRALRAATPAAAAVPDAPVAAPPPPAPRRPRRPRAA
jgi:hypothetical protein